MGIYVQRVIEAWEKKEGSQRQLAQRYKVSLSLYASEQDTPRITNLRYEFRHWLLSVDPGNLVFVDESGVNLGMARLFARAVRGQRAVGHKPRNTGLFFRTNLRPKITARERIAFSRSLEPPGADCQHERQG